MRDEDTCCDVLCLQELDVPVASVASFTAACRRYGLHVFMSEAMDGLHRTGILSKVPGRALTVEGIAAVRCTCALFEVVANGQYVKILLASIHACPSDPALALTETTLTVEALRATRLEWVLFGDFNLDPLLDKEMSQALSQGLAWHWDEPFSCCPATRGSGRRLDYALGTGRLFPAGAFQAWTFSDHAIVGYEVDLSEPCGARGPARRALCAEPVAVDKWRSRWGDGAEFLGLLSSGQVDEAWTLLSDAAEDVLCEEGVHSSSGEHGSRRSRSAPWKPFVGRQGSKAARGVESLVVVQLRRLHRRLLHLRANPWESGLRAVVRRQLRHLSMHIVDLRALPAHAPEAGADAVGELVAKMEDESCAHAMQCWRNRMREAPALLRAWIKRRAKEDIVASRPVPDAGSPIVQQAVHPVRVVAEAEQEWMRRWECDSSACNVDAVSRMLTAVPLYPPLRDWKPDLSGPMLFKVAKSMKGKAAGPDSWRIEDFLLLPEDFWHALSLLWAEVVTSGVIPRRWSEGRVVLIPKASTGMRPLTVLNVAWRIGAKALAASLRRWASSWASCRTLGGICRRSVRDVFLRVIDSLEVEENCYVQQDLSKFFDSVRIPQLLLTLQRFGAPPALCDLVRGFYASHWRVFSYMGTHGKQWKRITCGLAQGCPLSPVLVAVLMAAWSCNVEGAGAGGAGGVHTASFVDDRLVWSASAEALCGAMDRSNSFDEAYHLDCDVSKCHVGVRSGNEAGEALAAALGYSADGSLDLLGVRFALDSAQVPVVSRFVIAKARRLIHVIGLTPASLELKQLMMRTLVLPLATWAGGFARIEPEDLSALDSEATWLLGKRNVCDAARVVLCEVAGWESWPTFAYQQAALREAIRLQSVGPVWIEDAPLTLAARKWFDFLPVTKDVVRSLGWWPDPAGSFLYRSDSTGCVRQFQLGVDNRDVLFEWLRDHHRRQRLGRCIRVKTSLRREPEPQLAQGLDLPGPPANTLCLFRGHVEAWRSARDGLERATALAGGCTHWYKLKRSYDNGLGPLEEPLCLCGLKKPSRPHLLWFCPCTATFREGIDTPTTRLEERLLARSVPETPRPPIVVDYQDYVEDVAAIIDEKLSASPDSVLFVATDGSVVDTVAAWSLTFEDEQCFAQGVGAEDQTPHRAELEGLLALLRALDFCRGSGVLHVICDCKAALQVADGGGLERLMAGFFTALRGRLRDRLDVRLWWCPSHGKSAPARWLCPPCGEVRARRLNALADGAARQRAGLLAAGSARQRCAMLRRAAAEWERTTLTALRAVARVWMDA
ncbi:unnamed protein product [Symbiodinium pilosum]|uniref:Reverse transcriptase domain-containing protein n=1 Tax=Symbiodinium pilosum TaxID=2952 RepID=A0A812W5Y4_SYMPI|nr:unnamed protein product [Symbiodinium pilosum]